MLACCWIEHPLCLLAVGWNIFYACLLLDCISFMLACCWIEYPLCLLAVGLKMGSFWNRKTGSWDQLAARTADENGSHPTVEDALERQELVLGGVFFRAGFPVWWGQRPEKVVKKCHFPLGGDACQLRDRGSAETKTSGPLIISSVLGQASHRISSGDGEHM